MNLRLENSKDRFYQWDAGRIWANAQTTVEKEVTVTDNITATNDNPYKDGNRLGSYGDVFSNDATDYHLTPLIDLTKYAGKTIQLHLEGCQYGSTGVIATWLQCRPYGTDKAVLGAIVLLYLVPFCLNVAVVVFQSNTTAKYLSRLQ